ncbi:serine protease 53-like [Ochlerotatus camptorhynchus]|uniref:serine protease 53-like n=1 Tax=Ochlerotatus camptorhynchus TaxID=644619 RepID=UPI0031D362A7
MYFPLILILWLSAITFANHQSNNALYRCGIRKRFGAQLIHHARTAELGQWPWHVAIYQQIARNRSSSEGEYKCGGTLIDQQHVLTSAHCVVQQNGQPLKPHQVVVHLGKHDLYEFADQLQIVNVSKVHIHEEYSPNRDDLALLVLDAIVRYSEFVIPICLEPVPGGKSDDLVGQRGWVAGWGVTENGTLSRVLKTTQMPVVDITECAQSDPNLFGRFVSRAVFCASDRNGTSVCLGDSGGGMYFSVGDRWELRGIVSFGSESETGSCDTSKYIMFTNVAHYYPWIRNLTDGRVGHFDNVPKRISERKCEEYAALARKKSNGVCYNARYPHTVTIIHEKSVILCSGSLISELFVLSSAACIELEWKPSKIRIGSQEDVDIHQVIVHPDYNRRNRMTYLLLMQLVRPLVLGARLLPACLANSATENLYDTLIVTGYTGNYRRFYENVNMRAISTAECSFQMIERNAIRRNITSLEICVVAQHEEEYDGEDYLLGGITGASLQTFNSRSCVFTTLGVSNPLPKSMGVSFEYDIEVYTRVAAHLDWLEAIVWGTDDGEVVTTTVATMIEVSSQATTVPSRGKKYDRFSHDFYFPDD